MTEEQTIEMEGITVTLPLSDADIARLVAARRARRTRRWWEIVARMRASE